MDKEKNIMVRPYTDKELMSLYNISNYRTWKRWLKPISEKIGKRSGYYYSVAQVDIILKFLGLPHNYEEGSP